MKHNKIGNISLLMLIFMLSYSVAAQQSNRWTTVEQREAFATKVKGYEDCTQCHKFSVEAWKRSSHFKSLETLNLDKEGKAKAIMKAMGLEGSPASHTSCAQCHFTDKVTKNVNQFTNKKFGPVYGVSCESCHGASEDWIELHNKSSLKDIKDKFGTLKSDAQKAEFLKSVHMKTIGDSIPGDFVKWRDDISAKAGMIRPQMTYALINNCYECHTIGDKDVVNKTAELDEPHAAGSEFEIVAWLSGEVKHSFKDADPDNPKNKPFTIEEKRFLYVAGKVLFAEHAFRALSTATFPKSEDDEPTRFYEEMAARAEIGLSEITDLNDTLEEGVPEIKMIAEKAAGILEKIGEGQLKAADITGKTIDGKSIVEFLAAMNKQFLDKSSKNAALSKLDETLNEIEPQGSVYK